MVKRRASLMPTTVPPATDSVERAPPSEIAL
jgi:hypothetical protein